MFPISQLLALDADCGTTPALSLRLQLTKYMLVVPLGAGRNNAEILDVSSVSELTRRDKRSQESQCAVHTTTGYTGGCIHHTDRQTYYKNTRGPVRYKDRLHCLFEAQTDLGFIGQRLEVAHDTQCFIISIDEHQDTLLRFSVRRVFSGVILFID